MLAFSPLVVSTMMLVAGGVCIVASSKLNHVAECRIYSEVYKEYMYAVYMFLGITPLGRPVKMWREKTRSATTMKFKDDDESGVWYFERVPDRVNSFYIRNKKYKHEYLSGSDLLQDLTVSKNRRGVHTSKLDDRNADESFIWQLRKVPDTYLYYIWSVKYDSPIYAREYFTVQGVPSRTVSIWHQTRPVSPHFEWRLKCRDDLEPYLIN